MMSIQSHRPTLLGATVLIVIGAVFFVAKFSTEAPVSEHATPSTADFDHPPMQSVDGSFDDAESLHEALEQNPDHTPVLLKMGQLALEQGDAEKAVEHLRRARAVAPDDLDVRLELGRALYQSGHVDEALQETESIVEADPSHVDALYNLGAIHANLGDNDTAAQYWERASTAAPESPSGRNARTGLQALGGAPAGVALPDIPEHRNIRNAGRGATPNTPPETDPAVRKALVDFAVGK